MKKVITVKTDENTKKKAQELAQELGITLSSLINSYLKQVIVTRRVELYVPEKMTTKLISSIEKANQEIKSGQIGKGYDNVDDFLNDLNS